MTPIVLDVVVIEELHYGRSSHTHGNVIPGVVHDLWSSDSHKSVANWLPKQFLPGLRLVVALVAEDHSMQPSDHATLMGSQIRLDDWPNRQRCSDGVSFQVLSDIVTRAAWFLQFYNSLNDFINFGTQRLE